MKEVKRCERCYKIISRMESSDWYSHMSIKYCDECKALVRREQNAANVAAFRKRKKETEKQKEVELKNLKLENEILRQKVAVLMMQ